MKGVGLCAVLVLAGCASAPLPPPVLPSPPPPVPAATCPVKTGDGYFVDLVVGHIGGNPQQFTATPKYCGFPIRDDVFKNCGKKCCLLGTDGGNEAAILCEKELSGPPEWHCTDALLCLPAFDGNPYNLKVTGGQGILKACGKSGCSNEVTFP